MAEQRRPPPGTEVDSDRFQQRLAKWLADVAEDRAKMATADRAKRGGRAA